LRLFKQAKEYNQQGFELDPQACNDIAKDMDNSFELVKADIKHLPEKTKHMYARYSC
jgi:hypothetical protein